jgi:hypothetical protein
LVNIGSEGAKYPACVGILQGKTALDPEETKAHRKYLPRRQQWFVNPSPCGSFGDGCIGHVAIDLFFSELPNGRVVPKQARLMMNSQNTYPFGWVDFIDDPVTSA